MSDSDDSSSETWEAILQQDDLDEAPLTAIPLVEDLAGDEKFLTDEGSLASLVLTDGPPVIKPRPYQIEMLELSLKGNVIVAMDTGSGKTHIAVMRMLYELERVPTEQIIWFLATTVSLCAQQFDYIRSQLSAVEVKFLSGADGVDRWTEQSHWDAVLLNVKVVVSTYQILLDALSHGFVQMASLALIVFDEAHNCIEKHPGAMLMTNFYHKRKALGLSVPHILGLTASPVMRPSDSSLSKIEKTLRAICRTPSKHRAELRLQVNLPVLSQVYYKTLPPDASTKISTRTMVTLGEAFRNMKLSEDPYYLGLVKENSERSRRKLEKVRLNQKTWCFDQMKSFTSTAQKIWEELGAWAADYYVSEIVRKVQRIAGKSDSSLGIWDISNAEKQYLAKALRRVEINDESSHESVLSMQTTDKIEKVLDILLDSGTLFSGIIFVQERAMATVLAKLISIHPKTYHKFKVGVMVGTSVHNQRARNMGELIDSHKQGDTLSKFKSGKINLVVATSVLEEGIDVPACNLVLCFQKPANLKSFVQRRGRARHRESRLVILLNESDKKVDQWQQLEDEMRRIYEDEMRTLNEELIREDAEEHDGRALHVETTNALLDLDNAVSHLYHFCATLPGNDYVDLRPEFICSHVAGGLITARVILPISVHENFRVAESQQAWMSEKNAIKDAAFEAYAALYRAGLVNDNLLPLLRHDAVVDELMTSAVETQASIVAVSEQLNPWIEVAKAWATLASDAVGNYNPITITIGDLDIDLCMPVNIPHVPAFPVYWDSETELSVSITMRDSLLKPGHLVRLPDETLALLRAGFGARFEVQQKFFPMQFVSRNEKPLRDLLGLHEAAMILNNPALFRDAVIRDKFDPHVAYTFLNVLPAKPHIASVQYPYKEYQDTPEGSVHLSLKRLPRRNDFLHKVSSYSSARSNKEFSHVLPVSRCTIDELSFKYVQLGRLIPSIMHRIGVSLIAHELSTTVLQNVKISDLSLVLTAISASSAQEDSNYQRLEFLGDSILKTCASIQLISEFPLWHEGYLSAKKDRLVSNSRLSRAALEIGLDKFIITKAFTGSKWRPPFVEDLLALPSDTIGKRHMSTKVLADVVEALIGAATVGGDIPKALACMQTFLPEIQWKSLEERRSFLYQRTPELELPTTLQPLETLIGYTFSRKALLIEAMTHASCNSGSGSLERFEFLGDSILDNIIVMAMWSHNLTHFQMHLLRTALVNADFLAFMCMEWSIQHEVIDLEVDQANGYSSKAQVHITEKHKTVSCPLWRFMRHMSPKLGFEQATTATRHAELRAEIIRAIEHGSHYPWALLSRLRAHKYYSDIIESLLGAVWIDSGSFDVCREIVGRMGILTYLNRILKVGVHVLHPKEELGILADVKTVKYVMEKVPIQDGEAEAEEEERQYVCSVFVGEQRVVQVAGNLAKGILQTMAAEKAVEILKAKRKEKQGGDEAMKVQAEIDNRGKNNAAVDVHMSDDW